MPTAYSSATREAALLRLRAGETAAAVSADTGIGRATLSRWRAGAVATAPAAEPDGKLCDLTGPGISDRWGVTATDLGASVLAPNGTLVSVFGDTFSGNRVGEGAWRSPVVLIGDGGAGRPITWRHAGGPDPEFAQQLWFYVHDATGPRWTQGGISTVLPSDLLRVGDALFLHVMVNRGFPEVIWTEIWRSDDSGVTWQHMGEKAKFPAAMHNGYAQCWSWDYDPDDDWVYVVSTSFKRDKGIILRRVRPDDIGDMWKYSGWGWAGGRWGWDNEPTPITPGGETWGELSLRRLEKSTWILGGFLSSKYALGYRVVDGPTANMYEAPIQMPVTGCAWDDEDHATSRVAQLYGGYVLPGSRLDVAGGVGLVVSQWNTTDGWPYRAMQFTSTLRDTRRATTPGPTVPIDL